MRPHYPLPGMDAELRRQHLGVSHIPDTGDYKASQRAQAKHVRWTNHRQVGHRLNDLRDRGFVEIVLGSADLVDDEHSCDERYAETPTQRLHPKLRAKSLEQTLADYFAERTTERMNTTVAGMTPAEVKTLIDERFTHHEERIAQLLEKNSAGVFETLYAFRFGETPAASWERVLRDET